MLVGVAASSAAKFWCHWQLDCPLWRELAVVLMDDSGVLYCMVMCLRYKVSGRINMSQFRLVVSDVVLK